MKVLNDLFLFMKRNGLKISDVSKETGINYHRLRRIVHSENMYKEMKVDEMNRIVETYPTFLT